MYNVGIVGHGKNKFDERTTAIARGMIYDIIMDALNNHPKVNVVSGHSPMGGVDIWAEDAVQYIKSKNPHLPDNELTMDIKAPRQQSWYGEYGYKARNLDIARTSDIVHVIVVSKYPDNYRSRRFDNCYHCHTTNHIKSGACWTAKQAMQIGKQAVWHII